MAKGNATPPAGRAGQPWDCRKMRFPEVLAAPGRLLDTYPVLACIPGAADAPDALLRYAILRAGKGSPFHQIIDLPARKGQILRALNADADAVAAILTSKSLLPLCLAYLRRLDPLGLQMGEWLATEEQYWQDVERVAQKPDAAGDEKGDLKDDALLKAHQTRATLRKELPITRRELEALRNEIFNTDHELRDAALADEDESAGFVEAHTQGETFVPKRL